MANISREDDLKDLQERRKHGRRLQGKTFKNTFIEYNKTHGTKIADDDSLKRYLHLLGEHLLYFRL